MFLENNKLFLMPVGIESRWASPENPKALKGKAALEGGGRKGSPWFPLKHGEQRVLAEENGNSGTIRRIWVTLSDRSPAMLRGLKLEFFWDGAEKPAVSAPLGDFFGIGLGRTAAFQAALFTSPEGRSSNSYVPMPFKKGMRVIVSNESGIDLENFYYDINYTLGDVHPDNMLYFHAHYRSENPTVLQMDYAILPRIYGKGRFLGCNIGVSCNRELYFKSWWGEGEVKIYLDGDELLPTLCGTGTEDYIGAGWGQGRYDHLYQGCTVADHENMHYCFYRYHIPDPVYFRKDIRVTIQQIGCWSPETIPLFHDHNATVYSTKMEPIDFSGLGGTQPFGLFERSDDWSSCAYFYLDRPEYVMPDFDNMVRSGAHE